MELIEYILKNLPKHFPQNLYINIRFHTLLGLIVFGARQIILFDRFNMPEDLFEIVFSTSQQKIVAAVLISRLKKNSGKLNRTEMSEIATELHEGRLQAQINEPGFKGKVVRLSYNKRQFYDRILAPLRGMGMIDYDLYRKYYKLSEDFYSQMVRIGTKWTDLLKESEAKKAQATAYNKKTR